MSNQGIGITVFDSDTDAHRLVRENQPLPVAISSTTVGNNNLTLDAWGRQKVTIDRSLLHGMFTYDVADRVWEEWSIASSTYTPLATTGTLATSVNNYLQVSSGTTANNGCYLRTKRSPRYQPNRGHLHSTAYILPNPTGDGRRKVGVFCSGAGNTNGVYFELEGDGTDWILYAVRISDGVVKTRQDLTAYLPEGYDPSKGHVYDIQYQWRGLGNYKFFIDLQEIWTDSILGTLTELSLRMPALPASFESVTDTTTALLIQVGCVDITSEGGIKDSRQFASISTGTSLLNCDANSSAMIGIKIPRTITYNAATVQNTRDLVASKISSWTRDEAAAQVYFARDIVATNLDGLTWLNLPDSTAQYLIGGAGSTLDNAFATDQSSMQLVLNEWDDIEQKNVVLNPDPDSAPFYISAGDILIIAVQSFAGTDKNATSLYLSEEI